MTMTENGRPDPTRLLRQSFAQYQALQAQMAQLQVRMLTIVELAGLSAGEANALLGMEFFAEVQREAEVGA